MCICSHGLRTVGVCAHRSAFLKFLRNAFTNQLCDESTPISKAHGNILINIENNHTFKRTKMGQYTTQRIHVFLAIIINYNKYTKQHF